MFHRQSLSFTLWWRDDAGRGTLNTRLRSDEPELRSALRVFVQFQSYQDHVTITFYVDGAKKFYGQQLHAQSDAALTRRQNQFFKHLTTIRSAAHKEIKSGAIELASSKVRTGAEVIALQAAADYLYAEFWDEFQDAFGFNLAKSGEEEFHHGVVFVNQRGLMMSMRGLETSADQTRGDQISELRSRNNIEPPAQAAENVPDDEPWLPSSRGAYATLGPVDVFDKASGEPEVVLKSLWPFLRCITPGAENSDWVGCGILEWRALLVSTFGSRPQAFDDASSLKASNSLGTTEHDPDRFFIVTKGEPHRKQIGRMVERLTSLETLRFFSFKNIGVIQNSYLYLRVLTSQLDDILKSWSTDRQNLEDEKGRSWKDKKRPFPRKDGRDPGEIEYQQIRKEFYDELSALNERVELRLIRIGAELELMGPGGSGHLAYSIDRARYCISEFRRLVPSLEVENIAGWTNYSQFVDRGLQPTFNMIAATGSRLAAAQDRLKSLTDIVQVSALIVQSDATRRNTDTLREIGNLLQRANQAAIDNANRNEMIMMRFAGKIGWSLTAKLALVGGSLWLAVQVLFRFVAPACKALGWC